MDLETQQVDFEIDFFGRVLARSPDHVDVLRRQVELLASRGDYRTALVLDRRLVRLLPSCCIVRYNLACSLAMTDDIDAALQSLQTAIELGYRDVAHIESDSDLDPLRDHPGYVKLLSSLGGSS